jgi:hypothetical protein
VALDLNQIWCLTGSTYRDKKVVVSFVRFFVATSFNLFIFSKAAKPKIALKDRNSSITTSICPAG